jgi:hypothetical protein
MTSGGMPMVSPAMVAHQTMRFHLTTIEMHERKIFPFIIKNVDQMYFMTSGGMPMVSPAMVAHQTMR